MSIDRESDGQRKKERERFAEWKISMRETVCMRVRKTYIYKRGRETYRQFYLDK